jgi:hypothetical protein
MAFARFVFVDSVLFVLLFGRIHNFYYKLRKRENVPLMTANDIIRFRIASFQYERSIEVLK